MTFILDDCANCGHGIRGELIGVLATGPLYDWRHVSRATHGCHGRVDRDAPFAIPASEVAGDCPVHGKVGEHHSHEGTVR